ncbi:nucleolin-like [Asparagus officinalis]|uniref:nucleolin-like n=1 Tax=Asparagus officinalis TaxID=4686 RepID=UPI00098E689E|nr:nucleolin-like [Asparagus officinalis]
MPNIRTSLSFCTWYQAASQISAYSMNTSCLRAIRKWYASKKSAKRFRDRGANEYLSYEKSIPEDERQQSPEQVQEEVRMPDTREVEPSRVQTRSKSATGKRALGPVEEAKYDKRARRKLALEPPASKLMSDAQKAWHTEEEERESTAMELLPRPGLPNVGPALRGPASSAHSLNEEERGDESFAGGMEFAPEDTLHDSASTAPRGEEDIPPVQEPTVTAQQDPIADKSPSASVLLPPVGGTQPSPTTGVISKPTITEDPPAFPSVDEDETIDHSDGADATDDDGDQSGNNDNLGDDSDDPDDWDIPPPSSSDKVSAYIPLPLTASTEVVDMPRSSNMGELMALQSSPSQLDIGVPSQATTPKSPAGLLLGSVSSEVSVPSPIAVSSPTDVPDFLKISLDYLESLTRKIASTFEDIRAEEVSKYEVARRHIAGQEVEVEHLQQLHAQKQAELTLSNTSLENLREKIITAETELTRMKAQFKREEAIVTELNVKSATSLVNYRKKASALDEAKKEVDAMLSSEDELRKRAEMLVRADHEGKLSDIKSQLASFSLMN